MIIIFPSDYFNINKIDNFYAAEYDVVNRMDEYETILFHFDLFMEEDKFKINKKIHFSKMKYAIYRGFMMPVVKYYQFYERLLYQHIQLLVSPEQYAKMHLFPNVYEDIKDYTPKIKTFKKNERLYLNYLLKYFDRFMIKDFVKSVKNTNFPLYFDQNCTEQQFKGALEIFFQYRGSAIEGGICVKSFVDLKKYDSQTNEYRAFYYRNSLLSLTKNSNARVDVKPPIDFVLKFKDLSSPYYTIDFAELENSEWIIIEAGDGQVSGLSDEENIEEYYQLLMKMSI